MTVARCMVTWFSGCWEWSRRRCFSPITQKGRVCTQRAVNVWWIMEANDCSHFSCHQLCSLSVSAAACRHVTVTRCHCRHAARRNHDNDVSLLWQACKIHLMNDNRKIHVEQRHDQRLSLSSALSLSLCNFGILWLKPRRIELIFGIFNRVELNGCLDPPTERVIPPSWTGVWNYTNTRNILLTSQIRLLTDSIISQNEDSQMHMIDYQHFWTVYVITD